MKITLLFPSILLALLSISVAETPCTGKESIEWCDIWITHANESNLPRVLLLGDSISKGYFTEVEKQLAGKASVNRLATSAFATDPALLAQIAMVLDANSFEVIHFNNGMHGWNHNEEEYARGLPLILETIRKHAPKAKLIWASTTPLNGDSSTKATTSGEPVDPKMADSGKLMLQDDLKQRSNERVKTRNAIALTLMKKEKIPVDDLYALMVPHPELHAGDVHFTREGSALEGRQVSAEIRKLLP